MIAARSVYVRGVVQGVGFRPFVYRLALAHSLSGWVRNEETGVEIHLEGGERQMDEFLRGLREQQPPAARITAIEVHSTSPAGMAEFTIRASGHTGTPVTRIAADLPVCPDCLKELFDPAEPRYRYPYINCTNCGPRYSVIERLPYDRANTVMRLWPMDAYCAGQYGDPAGRRFHAQPIACPSCGPGYSPDIGSVAERLRTGAIAAIKGLGGYHLACDARNPDAVSALRERKFRKERPFAVMVRDLSTARELVELTADAEALLTSTARPIVLAPATATLPGVAPETSELGIMLPYTPVHHLLFAAGAPSALVMTSANRSSEPIAYEDADARQRLSGIADLFLTGERPIVRRVDDSVARVSVFGPMILRRSRGYAPGTVAELPCKRPILAVGGDLKNAIALAVQGQVFVSQHIGGLEHHGARAAFEHTIADLMSMYEIDSGELLIACDAHPEYASTVIAGALAAQQKRAIQHHRAHIASVLAERGAWDQQVVGVSFDGTGYGDDGSIWGGEVFSGSVSGGLDRGIHLRPAVLAGGDAAARFPVQSAAGFLAQLDRRHDWSAASGRFELAQRLIRAGVRVFPTTSIGRLFDAAAALLGFTREITFEGQAAMWLEQLAQRAAACAAYPFPLEGEELDFRPLLDALMRDRQRGRDSGEIARAFHAAIAQGVRAAARAIGIETVVLSGGVFQNQLLLGELKDCLEPAGFQIWTNSAVPPNDGGICLGQAALAAFPDREHSRA
ncbi:MAG: carbamoyltransferase HypF [Bryobacteraceae bacterium]|nr:carbamoyltransferase HypF [Bryobacteraceae bacterium]